MQPTYMTPRAKADIIIGTLRNDTCLMERDEELFEPLLDLAVQVIQDNFGDKVPTEDDISSLVKNLAILKRLMLSQEMRPITNEILIHHNYITDKPVEFSHGQVVTLLNTLMETMKGLPIMVTYPKFEGNKTIMSGDLAHELFKMIFESLDAYISTII